MSKKIDISSKMNIERKLLQLKQKMLPSAERLRSIKFDQVELSHLPINFLAESGKKSCHLAELEFTNFLKDEEDIRNTDCLQTLSRTKLFLQYFQLNSLRRGEYRRVVQCNPRTKAIFSTFEKDINHFLDLGLVYKIYPKGVQDENIGVRVFIIVLVDDSNTESIKYHNVIFLIDIYHLAILSKHVYDTNQEYKAIYYTEFKDATRDIFTYLENK